MCGIAGFTTASPDDAALIDRMTRTLAHRGPDAHAVSVEKGVALGHRRLAIIDLASGAQPMTHEPTGCRIVFNGEIYNYLDVNTQLEARGHRPRTRSDTETILAGWVEWGPAVVEHLNGMFAFAIHDPRTNTLFAARDRMGKKPFYYVHRPDFFAFASEPKALLVHPKVDRAPDPRALARYLVHEHVPAPWAVFRGMKKLPGGHALSVDLGTGRLSVRQYWEASYDELPAPPGEDELDFFARRIREELLLAVKRRLVSDVPLGALLSGGVDSSAVVAAMVALQGPRNVRTFSIAFQDPSWDESEHARFVARTLGTQHHERTVEPATVLGALPAIEAVLDEPLADASILPTYVLSKFAREHVTVALGGDGGDELFAGYDTFRALGAARFFQRVPLGPLGEIVAAFVPTRHDVNFSLSFKLRQFLRGASAPDDERLARWLASFLPEELPALVGCDVGDVLEEAREQCRLVAHRDAVTRDGHFFTKSYMQDGVLVKVDRATMAVSLEARAPLLDRDLVALANGIPSWMKFPPGKRIFKRALEGLVPRQILARPKKGFGIPVGAWLRGPLRPLLEETLSEERLRAGGFLRPEAVRQLVDEHISGARDHRKPLWTLFMLERWRARFG